MILTKRSSKEIQKHLSVLKTLKFMAYHLPALSQEKENERRSSEAKLRQNAIDFCIKLLEEMLNDSC